MIKVFTGAFGVRLLGIAAGFILQFTLTNIMEAQDYGAYVYVFSWVMFLSIIARLGFDNFLIKKIPEYLVCHHYPLINGLIFFSKKVVVIVALLIGILYMSFIYLGENELTTDSNLYLLGFLFVLPFLVLAYLTQSVLVALKKPVIANIPISIIKNLILTLVAGCIFFMQKDKLSADTIMLLNGGAFLVSLGFLQVWLKKHLPLPCATASRITHASEWVKRAVPFTLYAGASFLNRRLDILMLGLLSTYTAVGVYNIVSSFIAVVSLGSLVSQIMGKPVVSELNAKNKYKEMHEYSLKLGMIGFLLTFVCTIFLIGFGSNIFGYFGNIENVDKAFNVLLILLFGKLLYSLFGLSGVVLLFTKYQTLSSKLEITTVLLSVAFNYFLILKYGIYGAAIGTSIVLVLRGVVNHLYALKYFNMNFSLFLNFKKASVLLFSPKATWRLRNKS